MHFHCKRAAIALALSAMTGPACAEACVTFIDPARFTDASLYAPGPVDQTSPALVGLRRIFERLARRLAPGQDLVVEVLDLDLAGYFQPWRSLNPTLRVLTPAAWPRIRLRYAVLQDARVVASGEDTLTDMSYLQRPGAARSLDPLRFEEPMVQDWFAERLSVLSRATAARR